MSSFWIKPEETPDLPGEAWVEHGKSYGKNGFLCQQALRPADGLHRAIQVEVLSATDLSFAAWQKRPPLAPLFSRMRSEGSRFTWGSGGEAVFAKFCVCDRNRSQPSATACGDAVRLSTVASVSGVDQKACQIERLSPQLYWRLQRRCLRE